MKKKDFKDLLTSIGQARKIHKGDKIKEDKSQCCNAPVKVDGLPDFEGDVYTCTTYYVCTKCNKPCNVKGQKKKWYTSKEVWDKEWDKLLKGIKEMNKKLRKSIKRGIKDIEEGKVTKVDSVDKMFEEIDAMRKKHPIYYFFSGIFWGVCRYLDGLPLRVKTFIQRGKRGWANSDTWGFDYYLAKVISEGVGNLILYGNHKFHYSKALKQIAKTFDTAKKISEGDLIYIPSKDFKWKNYKKYKRDCAKMREKHDSKYKVMTKRESLEFEKGFDTFKEKFFRLWD